MMMKSEKKRSACSHEQKKVNSADTQVHNTHYCSIRNDKMCTVNIVQCTRMPINFMCKQTVYQCCIEQK